MCQISISLVRDSLIVSNLIIILLFGTFIFQVCFIVILMQGFITNNERALEELFGDEENNYKGVACLNLMARRIATVFASLRVCILQDTKSCSQCFIIVKTRD